ncbi:RraA family protein [Aliiruegeria lutimaris]|uniref:Putative 4-hydroxy-4-methyl-2-oxoglutarate aldolase n=1 Tax=Aliiruegeria lutimaris TaxID=571298 RepID=A0A1G8R1M9_9RHOB|nr:aldolase [Aliiruegeria lutimaris]SDJ10857.1 Regulator of RNase E activity RraA [Aliiruegeria lutimaris]
MIESPPILTIRRNFPRPTAAQVDAFRDVPTAFVCDAMGGQGAMASSIRAIGDGRDITCRAVGPALVADNGPAEILASLAALEISQPGDIIIAAMHGHRNVASADDLFCGMMKNKGIAGFVTDSEMRDYTAIVEVGLPVWCTGLNPNSPNGTGPGRVGFEASVGGRCVSSGDMIIADENGVVVVPFAQIDTVIEAVARVVEMEAELEAKVKGGVDSLLDLEEMIADGRAVIVD